ncbi:MAG: carbon storage regulator [Planctomycetales bacterium]
MLVLSRKPGEKIMIGDSIELVVVAVTGNRVKLALAAPTECHIRRAECGQHVQEKLPVPLPVPVPAMVALVTGCGV